MKEEQSSIEDPQAPEVGEVEKNYLKQLNLELPYRIFFWSTEVEWLDWQSLKDSLEAKDYISIQLQELDNLFRYIKCPPGWLLVGAQSPDVEEPVYGFVKAG